MDNNCWKNELIVVNSLLMIAIIFNTTAGASYSHSTVATFTGTKAEMNTQWGCSGPEVKGGASHGGLNFIYQFRNYQEEGFLCRQTCGRDAVAQAKPLGAPYFPVFGAPHFLISPWS